MAKKTKKISKQKLVLIIIVVMLIIITIGWFFWAQQKKEERRIAEEGKAKRLLEVESRIQILDNDKRQIEEIERLILIAARTLIGSFLVFFNFLHIYYFVFPFNLGDVLNFNGVILLGYSFFSFITYGTPTNLILNIKKQISNYLRAKHINSLEELELLKLEREQLLIDIKTLIGDQGKV